MKIQVRASDWTTILFLKDYIAALVEH